MSGVIEMLRSWLRGPSAEPATHLIDEAIRHFKQTDEEMERRIDALTWEWESKRGRPGRAERNADNEHGHSESA